jgi:lipoprotein-releasing system ATP-binding protein
MSEPAILCEGLEKTFSTAAETLRVLQGLDLSVEPGSRVAIMGASGSGKSTLLSILGGLDLPTAGRARVGGWELSSLPERRLAEFRSQAVGFVFQFHYLLKDFTALENAAMPAYMRGVPKKRAYERAASLLGDMGLGNRFDHFPSQLSGGERQRAAIARALVNSPAIVLADEPTGNLDAASSLNVREVLFGLSSRYGTTLVVVTHDQGLASQADLAYLLEGGALKPAFGAPEPTQGGEA